MTVIPRLLTHFLVLSVLVACTRPPAAESTPVPSSFPTSPTPEPAEHQPDNETTMGVCPLVEPVWVQPPEDSAVQDAPAFGYYFVNQDRSMWASAWWTGPEVDPLRVSEDGIKVGWFRPAGATLEITGERIDAPAPALEAHIPCCYPTRFQATGLFFPTEGCWSVTAKSAASELFFVVWVEP